MWAVLTSWWLVGSNFGFDLTKKYVSDSFFLFFFYLVNCTSRELAPRRSRAMNVWC